jgi:hypothetical protein
MFLLMRFGFVHYCVFVAIQNSRLSDDNSESFRERGRERRTEFTTRLRSEASARQAKFTTKFLSLSKACVRPDLTPMSCSECLR